MSSVTGGRYGVPPPTTIGFRNMRSSSTRPSSIAAEARPAPPISTSLSVASSAAATSSASGPSAGRAWPGPLRLGRRGRPFGGWPPGEAGVALNAVERAAEDDLRERAPGVGERGRVLVVFKRRIRLPREHRLVEPAAQQAAPELADLLEVEAKLLVARDAPSERAVAVGDEAVHRDAHRVDHHGLGSTRRRLADRRRALR